MFAAASAILYSCLLPLWEGFDEPAHYGYIEYLVNHRRLPVLQHTSIPDDIRQSLKLVPVSWILHNSLPESISFEQWFALSARQRHEREVMLEQLSPGLAAKNSDLTNYEAQQCPLAYLFLAPFDEALAPIPLNRRVLWLRFLASLVSTLLLLYATKLLARLLELPSAYQLAALACIFESQMLWASVAHVGNDWLSVPLSTLFLALLALVVKEPKTSHILMLAATLAAGLQTKAYFLTFVPVWLALMLTLLSRHRVRGRTAGSALAIFFLAVPWYARNLILYGSLSGTQETVLGIGLMRALAAFPHINWLTSTIDLFRSSLWTGNWSFTSFSRLLLNAELLLIASGLLLLLVQFRKIEPPEWWLMAACFTFYLGLIYQTCITWVATNARSQHVEPWYNQCILPCICILVFLGFARMGAVGAILALITVVLYGWVCAATYLVKLIPLYGGYSGRATLSAIVHWWSHLPIEALSATILGPISALVVALVAFLIFWVALNVRIIEEIQQSILRR